MVEETTTDQRSVYSLLTKLCQNIATENGLDEYKNLRAEAYEILLKKSTFPVKWCSVAEEDNFDALRALDEYLFRVKLVAKSKGENGSELEEEINALLSKAHSFFTTSNGNKILQLLLALQTNLSDDEQQQMPKNRPRELLVPGAFTLNAPFQNNRFYPQRASILDKNAAPKYFQSLQKMKANARKGFVPQNFQKSVRNTLNVPQRRSFHAKNEDRERTNDDWDCTFTGMTRRYICSDADWLRIDMRSLQFSISKSSDFYAHQMSFLSRKPLDSSAKIQLPPIQPSMKREKQLPVKRLFEPRRTLSWSWIQLGSNGEIQCAKPFVGDVNIPFELQALISQERKQRFQVKVLTEQQFLKDLKLLIVGLQSDTFHCTDGANFTALPDVTVSNVSPAVMANYVQEFIACGNAYKRLQTLIAKRDHKHLHEGFIFKAFCSAMSEYLLTFRQFVFSCKAEETFISFYKRMRSAMSLIQNLSLTLATKTDSSFPKGSQFLGYLYREIMRLTDNEFITLLMFLLKRCCHVYFKYLQLWLFHGVLEDPSKELFIFYIDHYRADTKHFYDKAYIVRKEIVPGFFQNYEDRILQCGKYTMLLKAYNPNHPIFELEIPKIAVRLSFEEIQKLEVSCTKYAEKAREFCGKPVTIKDIFEASEKRRKEFQKIVFQRSRENMDRWRLEQKVNSELIAKVKRQRFEELTAHMEEVKQNRIEKRRQSVELELKTLREAEKLNEAQLKKENINLRKRIEYYQELSDSLKFDASDYETGSLMSSSSKSYRRRHSLSNTLGSETARSTTSASVSHGYSTSTLATIQYCSDTDTDADNISINTEARNKLFEAEFAKTAEELCNYVDQRCKEYDNNNDDDKKKPKVKLEIPASNLKRSISDVINSNVPNEEEESPVDNLNALRQNRLKTLSGTIGLCFDYGFSTPSKLLLDNQLKRSEPLRVTFEQVPTKKVVSKALTEMELNKLNVHISDDTSHLNLHKMGPRRISLPDINLNTLMDNTSSELERNRKRMMEGPSLFAKYIKPESSSHNKSEKPQSDLERNRQKVLTEEYATRPTIDALKSKSVSNMSIHTLPDDMLTDLQRNRRRMMESPHPFTEYNKPALSERPTLNLNVNTERARNRRKVMESEYNIIPKEIQSTSTADVLSPMSTTSDPPLLTEQQTERTDIANGNLRLNIALATTETSRSIESNNPEPSTAHTQAPTTPLDALTTAGVRARNSKSFRFSQIEAENLTESFCLLNLTNDYFDEVDGTLDEEFHSQSAYKWSNELVQSKFRISKGNSIFRLNTTEGKFKDKASLQSHNFQNFKIDSLSVITLTEFLQKSIIMPMNTHMELVNGEVMRILLEDLQLLDHFQSLRHYFLLMDGEFSSIICDGIIGRVENGDLPVQVLSYQMLHMILDTALSCSVQKDNNAEKLSFIVSDIPSKFEINSPNALNVLSLSYSVQWPLNLILNPETLEQYATIFKYLLKLRRISWVLEKAFEILRQSAKEHGKRLLRSTQYLRVQQIRHKLYHFTISLQNHITATALEASWQLFKDELVHAKSLEDIYRMHTRYIKSIMFLCMLNRSSVEFYNAIESIFKISLKFYNNLKSREFVQRSDGKEFTHARFTKMVAEEEEFEKLIKYTIYLGNKIVRRGYQAEIDEFITLININKYYTTPNESESVSKEAITKV